MTNCNALGTITTTSAHLGGESLDRIQKPLNEDSIIKTMRKSTDRHHHQLWKNVQQHCPIFQLDKMISNDMLPGSKNEARVNQLNRKTVDIGFK